MEGYLPEDRADPQGSDTQTLQVADLAGQPFQRTAHPATASIPPAGGAGFVLHGAAFITRLEERGSAAGDRLTVITAIALLSAIREAVQHHKIQHLVLPGDR